MRIREASDPRLQALFGAGEAQDIGVRPVVRLPKSGMPGWSIAFIALGAALLLFWILESRREAQPQASVRERVADRSDYIAEPPPLYIPPATPPQIAVLQPPASAPAPPAPMAQRRTAVARPVPSPYYPPPPPRPPITEQLPGQRPAAGGPALVIDRTGTISQPSNAEPGASTIAQIGSTATAVGRVRASGLANRTTTVPQGVLIPAVLETALDSNHPGFARAIVSRDVRGFDGTRVLIPRGSRVIGEYQAEAHPGQNRALITWTRLIRPDGITIALDSPSVDTLGRGGVRASVDTHFWQQFGSALLRSTIDIGTGLAARAASGPTIFALPGTVPSIAPTSDYTPTLKVREGKSISIFVSRDLEFPDGSQR